MLFCHLQLLEELFARTHSSKDNFNILERLQPRQSDGLFCQIQNAHRLTHIEDENLATLAHGTGLEHQLCRLWDRHEVAQHIRMGYRNRSTLTDLLAEDGNYRARRADHVAETHRHIPRRIMPV